MPIHLIVRTPSHHVKRCGGVKKGETRFDFKIGQIYN